MVMAASTSAELYERYAGDMDAMRIPETIEDAAHEILRLPTAKERAVRTLEIAAARRAGRIGRVYSEDGSGAPENWRDSDGDNLRYSVWGPNRGKGGSLAKRRAIIHSLVHVESVAVELAWDIIARFGRACDMPEEFADDFVIVAEDEARHHLLLRERLHELGWKYGDAEVTGSLWNSACETKHSLPARLAIEHCVHEARGLDILPQTIDRLRKGGDQVSAELLERVIYEEEITHVKKGLTWFRYLHERGDGGNANSGGNVIEWFHATVRDHFAGLLKPPFNTEARRRAGFTEDWYEPLSRE